MKKLYVLLIAGSLLISFNACNFGKKKPEKKPVKKNVVHKALIDSAKLADSLALVEAQKIEQAEAEAAEAAEVVPDDKYFLISGSFHSMANAEKFQKELQAQGYNSEVIIRKTGPNTDFYKVSYKSFYDRDEAYNALRQEKKMPNNETVWLLVKN